MFGAWEAVELGKILYFGSARHLLMIVDIFSFYGGATDRIEWESKDFL